MEKIIKLTESDLTRIVKRVIEENKKSKTSITFGEYVNDIFDELIDRFDLSNKEADEIIEHYRDDIGDAFYDKAGYVNVKKLIDSFTTNGKLKWRR
jgi:hypothetical protein